MTSGRCPFAVGGGAGAIDSTDVVGGQGQDFTFNWFANLGLRYQLNEDFSLQGGLLFQHLSNAGATDPNPGLDVLGFSLEAGIFVLVRNCQPFPRCIFSK